MKRCVIVGGAVIEDYTAVRSYLREGDVYYFCDSGLRHREALGVTADLIIGDFDSWEKPEKETEVIVLPRKKDDTDTVFAVKEGIRRGFDDFLLLGASGQRLDHTLVNVYALLMLEEQGKHAVLVDDYSEMEVVGSRKAEIEDTFPYFSLVSIAGTARHVTIENAVFPLTDGEIRSSYQFATSNEVLPGKTASVRAGEGKLLLIRNRKA